MFGDQTLPKSHDDHRCLLPARRRLTRDGRCGGRIISSSYTTRRDTILRRPPGTISSRFYRWRRAGVWDRVLAGLQAQADARGAIDWDLHFVDATIIRAHQHAAGALASTPAAEALGRSQGGFSTKLHIRATAARSPPC